MNEKELQDYNCFIQTFDLSIARFKDVMYTGLMNSLSVYKIGDMNANLKIQFDTTSRPEIPLTQGDVINLDNKKRPGQPLEFSQVYITNDAVGSCEAILVFGHNMEFQKLLRITSDIIQEGIRNQVVTIGTTATKIPSAPLSNRINLMLFNNQSTEIFIGDSAVSAAVDAHQGIPMKQNSSMPFGIFENVDVYGIVASGTADLHIIEGA